MTNRTLPAWYYEKVQQNLKRAQDGFNAAKASLKIAEMDLAKAKKCLACDHDPVNAPTAVIYHIETCRKCGFQWLT